MKNLNILWIEDEHEDMQMFKAEAAMDGINFDVYKSAEDGLDALEAGIDRYDGILLDAEFFDHKHQAIGTGSISALSKVRSRIDQLRSRKAFTPFILTGKKHLDGNDVFKATYGTFYRKWSDRDRKQLLKDIRAAAEAMADTQIRHRYHRVFEVCTDRYIGEAAAGDLMSILRREDDEAFAQDAVTLINAIRKIVEDLFKACAREGLLPAAFTTGGIKLNGASKFLSGVPDDGFQVGTGVVPDIIGQLLKNILAVAQPASHRAQVDAHMSAVRTPYLLYSVTYMLLDVLLWFKSFADEQAAKPDRVLYTKPEGATPVLASGTIEQDERRNYHCGEILLGYKYTETNFCIGDHIEIQVVEDNPDPRTAENYPKRAKYFRKA